MIMTLLAASIASICSAGGGMTVFMQHAKLTEWREVTVDVAADATVGDLTRALLQSGAQIPGLAKGLVTANAINVSYQGQKLDAEKSLADAGICAESLVYYDVNEAVLLYGDKTVRIPIGRPDAISLMVEQISAFRANASRPVSIPVGSVIKVSIYKPGLVYMFPQHQSILSSPHFHGSHITDGMENVEVSVGAVAVMGDVRIVEASLLDADAFSWKKYDNADAAAKEMCFPNGCINVIEKPTIWEKFTNSSGGAVDSFELYHLVGAEQDAEEIKRILETQSPLSVGVIEVPHDFTLLFDVSVPAARRLV